jgi:PAS domain S-box-containing protein
MTEQIPTSVTRSTRTDGSSKPNNGNPAEHPCGGHLGSFFHSLPEPAAVLDPEGNVVETNAAFRSLFGMRPDRRPESTAVDSLVRLALEAGRTMSRQTKEIEVGGSLLLFAAWPVFNAIDTPANLMLKGQLQPRQPTESDEYRSLRLKLDFALEKYGLAAWEMDLQTGKSTTTPEHDRIFGYDSEAPVWSVQRFVEHIVPEDRPKIEQFIFNAARKESNWQLEYRIRRVDGQVRWIQDFGSIATEESSGNPIRILNILRDITGQRVAEEEFRDQQSQWNAVSESCHIGMWKLDLATMTSVRNAEHAQIFGDDPGVTAWSPEHFFEAVIPEDRKEIEKLWRRSIANLNSYGFECRIRRRDDRIRWISTTGKILHDRNGNARYMAGITIDITEKKEQAIERRRLQEKLMQSQKMDLIGQLAGGIAHDFNNVLAAIQGNTEMVLDKISPSHPCSRNLDSILDSVNRSAGMVRQLLAFARKEKWNPRELLLDEELNSMGLMLRKLISEEIVLQWHLGCHDVMVNLDPANLAQIVTNLFVNSRDAIDGKGSITIETGTTGQGDGDDADLPGDSPSGELAVITVSDTGKGIAPESLPRIYEPFFTTKEVGKGTGLGLAMVYGLVKKNNGHISCHSEPGKGTTFRIFFPSSRKPVEPGNKSIPGQPDACADGGKLVLVVDDEPDIIGIIAAILENQGFRTISAVDAATALDIMENRGNEVSLVLSDIVLPGMNGIQMSREILKNRPELPFIFMSGYSADTIGHHGVFDTKVNFIPKPFKIQELMLLVRQVLS